MEERFYPSAAWLRRDEGSPNKKTLRGQDRFPFNTPRDSLLGSMTLFVSNFNQQGRVVFVVAQQPTRPQGHAQKKHL